MAPAVIGHHRLARVGVELGVDGVEAIEAVLEALHLGGLAQHGAQQPPHQLQHPLLELEGAPAGAAQAAMGDRQTPDALDRIDAVAHPGIAVVAMHGVGGAGGQQAGDRMLAAEHHRLDLAIELPQQLPGLALGGWILDRRSGARIAGGGMTGHGIARCRVAQC